jgi:acetyl esterase/lipase
MQLPEAAQRGLARLAPTTPLARELLHPQFQALLAANATRPKMHAQTVRAARSSYSGMMHMLSPAPVPMAKSVDLQVPVPATGASRAEQILVRVHYPLPVSAASPAIMYMHGGGFTVGDVPSYDAVCRDIAAQTGFPVASVEYRMGPEHPAPAATEDCVAAWSYLVQHAAELQLDATRMAVMGDSAGGKLSAAVAQQAKQRRLTPPALQVLVYPGLDSRPRAPLEAALRRGLRAREGHRRLVHLQLRGRRRPPAGHARLAACSLKDLTALRARHRGGGQRPAARRRPAVREAPEARPAWPSSCWTTRA